MRFVFLAFLFLFSTSSEAGEVSLSVGPSRHLEIKRLPSGIVDLVLSGANPHFWSGVVPESFEPGEQTVLAFDYFSPSGIESISIRFKQPDGSMIFVATSEIPLAESWQPFSIDLSDPSTPLLKGDAEQRFHLSMKYRKDAAIQIRNLHLRAPNEEEEMAIAEREERRRVREKDADAFLDYLRADHPGTIEQVVVGEQVIRIKGHASIPLDLKELRPAHASHRPIPDEPMRNGLAGPFEVELPRYLGKENRDRALYRWRLDRPDGSPASLGRWPSAFAETVIPNLPRITAPSQKGLGGIPSIGRKDHEIFELGIHHATVNFVLDAVLSPQSKPGFRKIHFEGKPYFVNDRFLQEREATVRHLRANGIVVTCILLVGNHGSLLTHPEAERRGTFAMPNIAQAAGAAYYCAALDLLSRRFSAEGARISNWVVHNEVDQAGTWTNMGDQPLARYLESYHRSARLIYHTMRLTDPNARVFVSLTHHWTKSSLGKGAFTVRPLLELFREISAAEGDYEWGVAYNTYPQSLWAPDSWNDVDPTNDFETPYITPKNFEVLPRFLAQEQWLYKGKPRGILFSEQGFNTPTLSQADQLMQAAGLVELFERLPDYPVIEAFHLHRYQDMPDREGGLRLGIIDEHGNRKLGWHAYEAISTENVAPYRKLAEEVIRTTQD
ncbi:MAG: DUF5722 domain-containing protein [Verrucomicrobiota bacterium]